MLDTVKQSTSTLNAETSVPTTTLLYVQGLAALLVQGLSGSPPETLVQMDPNWISQMGLQQSLTPSRNNGFFNMFKLMQQKSLELLVAKVRLPSTLIKVSPAQHMNHVHWPQYCRSPAAKASRERERSILTAQSLTRGVRRTW